jgi:hypothetical protein
LQQPVDDDNKLDVFVKPAGAPSYVLFEGLSANTSVGKLRNLVAQHNAFKGVDESKVLLRLIRRGGEEDPTEEEEGEAKQYVTGVAKRLVSFKNIDGRLWLLAENAKAAEQPGE